MNHRTKNYEGLELSTQLLAREAEARNVAVEVLDEKDNFLRLSRDGRTEYVKQATRTSADSYIAPLIMENKSVTKRLLAEMNVRVPRGLLVHERDEAPAALSALREKGIVVKPNSTNFGLGVAVLKGRFSADEYARAVDEAFALDSAVVIEEFVEGEEYRFLVTGDEVVAVLQRMAANVTGDGARSISELVREKNADPLRGTGYTRPLERIALGAEEESFLRAQGMDFESVPDRGRTVFLRKNSNISTGGDSIDRTDDVHPGYKQIALQAARAVGARICGADIILRDPASPPTNDNYAVIELNFNPAIHIHAYPLRGTPRHAEKKVLDLIGFPEVRHA